MRGTPLFREQSATRDIPSLTLRAAVRAETLDPTKRTIDVVFSTGARVRRGFWEPFDEELSMDPGAVRMTFLNSGKAPVLDAHDNYSGANGVLGVVQSARVDGKQGVATLRFAKAEDDPVADQIFRKIADGIIANVSVGYRVHKMVKVEDGSNQVPVYRAVDWEPFEISPCGIPADTGVGFRSAAAQATNRCEIVTRIEEAPMEKTPAELAAAAATAEGIRAAEATRAAEAARATNAGTAAADLAAATLAATTAERTRAASIRTAVRAAKLDDKIAEDMITKGIGIEACREAVLEQLAARSAATPINSHIEIGDTSGDKRRRAGIAWLIQKSGRSDVVARAAKLFPEKFKDLVVRDMPIDLDPGMFRGMSLIDMVRDDLEERGVKVRGELNRDEMISKAMTRSVGGANSTSDFPLLLENTLHKVLLASYVTTPDTWSQFCLTGSVSDFRAHKRYRYGSFGVLDNLGEGGEVKNKSIPDATRESITAKSKANIIAITRQSIINDDMDAFSRLAMMLGRAARLTVEVDVYAVLALNGGLGPLLSDGLPLFDAAHGNIGAPAAISVVSIDGDRVLMASQKDQDNNEFLDLRPTILLVPLSLGSTARVINEAQYDPDTANKLQRPNAMRGLFSKIVDSPRLAGTRRYAFAESGAAPVIEVAFLNGQTEPFLENRLGWQIDGTEWKVRLDYGVAGIDSKGATTNAGV